MIRTCMPAGKRGAVGLMDLERLGYEIAFALIKSSFWILLKGTVPKGHSSNSLWLDRLINLKSRPDVNFSPFGTEVGLLCLKKQQNSD